MTRSPSELVAELRGLISDERVLRAVADVPRELFVPRALRHRAWENRSLPLALGQTISQPLVVARMCELLELSGDETVLDVGTGSGYHAAVLGHLSAHVYSVERHRRLAQGARRALRRAGVDNVTLLTGDGARGHADGAPYDAINVAARAADVPRALQAQLAAGGRLVMPLHRQVQRLVLVRRSGMTYRWEDHEAVSFVPLVQRSEDSHGEGSPAPDSASR